VNYQELGLEKKQQQREEKKSRKFEKEVNLKKRCNHEPGLFNDAKKNVETQRRLTPGQATDLKKPAGKNMRVKETPACKGVSRGEGNEGEERDVRSHSN